ncbi:MAG TPA: sulfur oxidation c-type cytochrome SoxA [Xanthobacteraceae bacterium]|nr:sulfur oxidation c-type cytochrome SoxA [Xanthobacteraceae bacterium]
MKAVLTLALGMAVALPLMSAPAVAQPKGPAPMAAGDAAARPWVRYGGWPTRDTAQFNTLAATQVSPAAPKAPRKLDRPVTGDASNGEKLVADRTRGGSCLACHVMGRAGDADLPGNVGPDLSEIGNGGRDDEWLWNYVYDARAYNPATVMPPWGTHRLFDDKEIGDIVAFLKTLKSPARFKTEVDDPAKRHAPVETRDNLDPTTNPAMWAVDKGEELYKKREASGFSCATCHGDAGSRLKTWAAAMPKWEPRFDKVIGIEEFVFRHAKATTGATWLMQSDENIAMAVYLRNVANGQEMTVDVASPGAKEAFERGRALAEVKIGALNFSCRDCHDPARGGLKWIRGQWLAEQKGQLDHFPTWRTSLNQIWDIRKRFQWCGVAIWANELPPDAKQYGDLELYLASVNAGQKLNVPGIRH